MQTQQSPLEHLQSRLQESNAKIATLKTKAESLDRLDMLETRKTIEDLEERQTKLRAQLVGAQAAAAWEDVKVGVEAAWQDLTEGLNSAHEKLTVTSTDQGKSTEDRDD